MFSQILKKNVIIILIDGGRFDRANHSQIFNKLRSKSIFFSQAITYAPYTSAALHALGSGCYGNRTGTNSYWHSYKFEKTKFKSLIEYLKDNGYYTCGDGQSDIMLANHGFHEFNIHDEKNDDLIERHTELLKRMKTQNDENTSFFLFLSYSNIHTGYMNEVMKIYNNFSKEYFENKELNEKRYDKLFEQAEKYLEKIFFTIEKLHLDENSLIMVISDHGASVGEKFGERAYGAFCYDYTLKTFAYLYSKDLPSKEITVQVRNVDFMPTILEYLGIDLDQSYEKLDGESLLSLIHGKEFTEKFAYSETGNPLNDGVPPKIPNVKSIRTSKWKLIFNEYNNTKELYDLENDPDEKINLAGKGLEIEQTLWNEIMQRQKLC